MKWLILLTLFSCATQTTTEESIPTTPPEVSTESDAKPVSPYTVEPCYCMKIFQPVCAGGKTYGNSCEAECQGHKTWKEDACPSK